VGGVPSRSGGSCTTRIFASVSGMAACITCKDVGDLPVLYYRMRARGRPAYCCCGALFILPWIVSLVMGCSDWLVGCCVL